VGLVAYVAEVVVISISKTNDSELTQIFLTVNVDHLNTTVAHKRRVFKVL
jgi:hypothetical protein